MTPGDPTGSGSREPSGGGRVSTLRHVPELFRFENVTVTGIAGARLTDVDLMIPAKGITAVVGPSGSGKSTLLRLCNRLELPAVGRILYRGTPTVDLDPLVLRRQVGMVFQKAVLFPGTVRDNLAEADGNSTATDYERVLSRVGLDAGFLDRNADLLSGGEAQRACLARALMADPEAILMDEPTSSLDGAATQRLEELARSLADGGIPVVWVSHDLAQMRRLADAVAVVVGGSIRFWGSPENLAGSPDPDVQRFLQGDDHADR